MIRISKDISFPNEDSFINLQYLRNGTYNYSFLKPLGCQNKDYLKSPEQMEKDFYSGRITKCSIPGYLRFNEEVRLKHVIWAYENGILKNPPFELDIFQMRGFGGFGDYKNFYEEIYNVIIVQNKQIISKVKEYITRTPKNSRDREFMTKLQNAGYKCSKGKIWPFPGYKPNAFAILIYFNEKPPKL